MATQSEINAALGLPPGINPDGSWNAQDYMARRVAGQVDTQAQVDAARAAARAELMAAPGQSVTDASGRQVSLTAYKPDFDPNNITTQTYLGELAAAGGKDSTSSLFNQTATPAQLAANAAAWATEKARLEEIDRQAALAAQGQTMAEKKTYTDAEVAKALNDLRYLDPNASVQDIITAAATYGVPKEQVIKNIQSFTYSAENVDKLANQILAQNTTSSWKGDVKPETAARYMADDLAKSGITDISQVGKSDAGIINTVTGEKLVSGYGERTKGNLWSGSYEGKGNTGFGVQFTDSGKPIFYTEGASSSTLKKDLLKAAVIAGAAYGLGGLEGIFGSSLGTTAGLTATEAAGLGLTASEAAAAGLSAADIAAAGLTTAGTATGTGLLTGGASTAAGTTAGTSLGTGLTAGSSLSGLTAGSSLSGLTAGTGALTGANTLLGGAALGSTLGGLTTGVGAGALTAGALTGASTLGSNALSASQLGSLVSGGLTTGAGLLQQQTSKEAAQQAQARIDAETAAAKQAAAFRPVGMTTRFGTSEFKVDPVTGQITSAGYTLSPGALQAQDRLVALGNQGLAQAEAAQQQFAPLQTGAQNLFNLGNQYIAQSPEQVAQNYLNQQMALLQPSRELELANLQNRLQQQGRGGLSVAQGGNLGATTPELQALFNARAQQEAQLAAQAQQAGQQQVAFGAGLLGTGAQTMGNYYAGQQAAYAPYTTALGQVQALEAAGQQPFTMGTQLGQTAAQAGANVGQLGLRGAQLSTALATSDDATRNLYSTLLGGLGSSSLSSGLLNGGLNTLQAGLSNTALGSSGFGTGLAYGNQDLGLFL